MDRVHMLHAILVGFADWLQGLKKIKSKQKMTTKHPKEYFFYQRYKKTATNTVMASRF